LKAASDRLGRLWRDESRKGIVAARRLTAREAEHLTTPGMTRLAPMELRALTRLCPRKVPKAESMTPLETKLTAALLANAKLREEGGATDRS
jgi:hypothetical protein